MHKVVSISKNLLPTYRDAFRVKWPKFVPAVCVFEHFIDRFNKHPEWNEKVKFLTLKDEVNVADKTFVMTYGSFVYFDTLEAPPYPKLENLLYHLDYSKSQMFINIRDAFRPVVKDIMRMKGMEKTYESGAKIIYFDVERDYFRECQENLPSNFNYKPIKVEDLPQILSLIPNPSQNCINYLKTVIKYNTATGLYENNGRKLVAWSMEHENGAQGILNVLPEYYRKNFGWNVLCEQLQRIRDKNRPIYGDVAHVNFKSSNLMNKFDKSNWLDNVSYIGFKEVKEKGYTNVWYHL